MGACLLLDGRVFFAPSWASLTSQAYVYDPALEWVQAAGEAIVSGYNSCTLLADGRVLLVPWSATAPLIDDSVEHNGGLAEHARGAADGGRTSQAGSCWGMGGCCWCRMAARGAGV